MLESVFATDACSTAFLNGGGGTVRQSQSPEEPWKQNLQAASRSR
jgi:hypothetical protein